MTAATLPASPARYKTSALPNGKVRIHHVPAFAEAVDPRGQKVEIYDRARLGRWLATAQQRQREGYAGPVHVGHNDVPGEPAVDAGVWLPNEVGSTLLDGAQRACLFVDLDVDAPVAERIEAGELPYLSCELKEDLSEVRSIALLPRTRAPFHKFALLSIDLPEATVKFTDGVTHFAEKAPKTTCSTCGQQITTVRGQVGSHLRDLSGQRVGCPGSGRPVQMADADAVSKARRAGEQQAEDEKAQDARVGKRLSRTDDIWDARIKALDPSDQRRVAYLAGLRAGRAKNKNTEGPQMADDKKPEDEKDAAPKMSDEDKKDDAPKMADAAPSDAVLALLQKIAEKLGIMGGEAQAEEAPADEAAGAPVELQHADKARSADPVLAGVRGELAALRRRIDDGERTTRFSDARGRLVRAGAGPDELKEFDGLAKKGASHEPAALAFADAIVRAMPKRAPDAGPWTGELPPRGVVPTDSDAVKKFADRGPLVLDEARRFAGQHALLVAKGMTSNSLEDYLSANIDGLQAAGKK